MAAIQQPALMLKTIMPAWWLPSIEGSHQAAVGVKLHAMSSPDSRLEPCRAKARGIWLVGYLDVHLIAGLHVDHQRAIEQLDRHVGAVVLVGMRLSMRHGGDRHRHT